MGEILYAKKREPTDYNCTVRASHNSISMLMSVILLYLHYILPQHFTRAFFISCANFWLLLMVTDYY